MSETLNDNKINIMSTNVSDQLLPLQLLAREMVSISTAEVASFENKANKSNKTQSQRNSNKNLITKTDQAQSSKNNNIYSDSKRANLKNPHKETIASTKNDSHYVKEPVKKNHNEPKNQHNNRNNMKHSSSSNNIFEEYWPLEKAMNDSTVLKGRLRINQRNFEDAFISDPNGGGDIYINGLKDRNRALNNDIIYVKLKEKHLWKILESFRENVDKIVKNYEANLVNANLDEFLRKNLKIEPKILDEKPTLKDLTPFNFNNKELLDMMDDSWFQKTGFVVTIIEMKHNRLAAGHLKLFPDKSKEFALFSPNDSRLPRIKIKLNECPYDFYTNPQFYANSLFIARIKDIPINSRYAIGELVKNVGKEGDIEAETEAMLIESGIDSSNIDEKFNESLPKIPWKIPDSEFKYRRDLRNLCIFTIDPATARDLDDALHIIKINDDLFEVGVHIADVSYFVTEDSPIDKCALERTTSVYLVQKVIPMLPRLLCEELCSLNPGLDRLTFSVIWKMKANGDVVEEWFGRTVINSAIKLSYDHAQSFIENPDKEFESSEFPSIRTDFSLNDIKTAVLRLNSVAKHLRSKRFANGSLALNQPKLSFILNKENYMPYAYNVYQQKDSNRLVEEYMLLANIAVANHIYNNFPKLAILRRHPPPNVKQIEDLEKSIKSNGYDCDLKSSLSIQALLQSIREDAHTASLTLTCLLTKTMQLAQYFCSGFGLNKDQFSHYALAVPLYTHFTSPIRRYPDVLVHRLLAASLGYCQVTERNSNFLNSIAENCNDRKSSARACSEKSSELFFSLFVNECGPFDEKATVIQINDRSFDVLIVNLGIPKRIYCDKLSIVKDSLSYVKFESRSELSFTWESTEQFKDQVSQTIKLFTTVNVCLVKNENDRLKYNVILKHPNDLKCTQLTDKTEESNLKDKYYDQQFDTDPYLLD